MHIWVQYCWPGNFSLSMQTLHRFPSYRIFQVYPYHRGNVMWRALHIALFCSFLFLRLLPCHNVADWVMPNKLKLHDPKHIRINLTDEVGRKARHCCLCQIWFWTQWRRMQNPHNNNIQNHEYLKQIATKSEVQPCVYQLYYNCSSLHMHVYAITHLKTGSQATSLASN